MKRIFTSFLLLALCFVTSWANGSRMDGESQCQSTAATELTEVQAAMYKVMMQNPNEGYVSATYKSNGFDTMIWGGDQIPEGAVIRLEAHAFSPEKHVLDYFTANGQPIEGDTYTLTQETTFSVVFKEKGAEPEEPVEPEYAIPQGDDNIRAKADGTVRFSERLLHTVTVEGATLNGEAAPFTSTINEVGGRQEHVFVDKTAETVELTSGDNVQLTFTHDIIWMHSYLYIDYNHDGVFNEDNELVAYSHFSELDTPDGFNSLGEPTKHDCGIDIPAFTVADVDKDVKTRMRLKIDWNSKNPVGNESQSIGGNAGTIVDFTANVHVQSETPAPAEKFAVNFKQPALGGTFKVMDGETEIYPGEEIAAGTVLAVLTEPAKGYELKEILVNNVLLEKGVTTFAVTEVSNLVVNFAEIKTDNQALVLNGSDQYMTIPNDAAFFPANDGGYTVTCRVKNYEYMAGSRVLSARAHQGTDNKTSVGYELVMNFDQAYDYNGGFKKVMAPFAKTSMAAPNGEQGWHYGNDNDMILTDKGINEWMHLSYVYDREGNCVMVYVDADDATKSVKTNGDRFKNGLWPNHGFDVLVGADWGAQMAGSECVVSSFFKGEIDDVHFYNKALTAEELKKDMDHFAVTDAALVAAYDFDAMDKTTVPDISGHGHDGVLHGLYIDNTLGNYEITVNQVEGGHITVMNGGEEITTGSVVKEGTELSIKAVPAEGYRLVNILVNGEPYDMYILPVVENTTISAEFAEEAAIEEHVLTYEVIGNGTITVSNAEGEYESGAKIKHGTADLTCTVTPDYGAKATSILVNGQEMIDYAFPQYGSNALFFFMDVFNEDCHIVATFEGGGGEVVEHAVNYTVTEGGSVAIKVTGGGQPNLNSGDKVLHESSLVCEITPEWGYQFVSVTVNGQDLTDKAQYIPWSNYYQLLIQTVLEDQNFVFTFAPEGETGIDELVLNEVCFDGQNLLVPEGAEVVLFNAAGQQVCARQGSLEGTALAPGTYVARVSMNGIVKVVKFIKK